MNKTGLASATVLLVLSSAPALGQSDTRAEQERAAAALAVEAEALQERAEELERAQAELQRAAEEVARLAQQKGLHGNRRVRMHRLEKSAKPRLGVWLSSEDGEPTVISRVAPASAAAEGGIEEGDVIVSVDGAAVLDLKFPQVATLISDTLAPKAVGDTVIIEVERDGERLQRELTLNKHSFAPLANRFSFSTGDKDDVFVFDMDREEQNAIFAENAEKLFELRGQRNGRLPSSYWIFGGNPWSDMELVELSEGLGEYFGTKTGLLVVRAPTDETLGFQDGDVILSIDDRKPETVSHAMRILGSYSEGEEMAVRIMRDRRSRTLDVAMPE